MSYLIFIGNVEEGVKPLSLWIRTLILHQPFVWMDILMIINAVNSSIFNKVLHRIIRNCNDIQLAKGTENPTLLLNFSCHSLRHTSTNRLVETGVNIKVIKELCGHTRSDVT